MLYIIFVLLQHQTDRQISNNPSQVEELIASNNLVPILMKYKTRRTLAAGLVQELVDINTWLQSNVNGDNNKKQLDPNIISYVERKCFEMHPHKPLIEKIDYKTAWQECVTSIDSKARDIKRRLKAQGKLA